MWNDLTREYARRLADAAEHLLKYALQDASQDRVLISREQAGRLRNAVQAFRSQDTA
jgi:hypothetical protein